MIWHNAKQDAMTKNTLFPIVKYVSITAQTESVYPWKIIPRKCGSHASNYVQHPHATNKDKKSIKRQGLNWKYCNIKRNNRETHHFRVIWNHSARSNKLPNEERKMPTISSFPTHRTFNRYSIITHTRGTIWYCRAIIYWPMVVKRSLRLRNWLTPESGTHTDTNQLDLKAEGRRIPGL